jgi:RNase P protein component
MSRPHLSVDRQHSLAGRDTLDWFFANRKWIRLGQNSIIECAWAKRALPESESGIRFLLLAPKRSYKRAHDRNKIKRWLRAAIAEVPEFYILAYRARRTSPCDDAHLEADQGCEVGTDFGRDKTHWRAFDETSLNSVLVTHLLVTLLCEAFSSSSFASISNYFRRCSRRRADTRRHARNIWRKPSRNMGYSKADGWERNASGVAIHFIKEDSIQYHDVKKVDTTDECRRAIAIRNSDRTCRATSVPPALSLDRI